MRDVLVRCPTVRDDVGAREAPLLDDGQQGLGSSVGHHLQHTSAALSFDGPEHPKSVVESPSVVFPMEKVALVYFYHDRLTVGIESSELHGVSSGVLSADIADEIRPVHERVLRHVKMPGNVVHGGVRRPREEHPRQLSQGQVALEKRTLPHAGSMLALTVSPTKSVLGSPLHNQAAQHLTLRARVAVVKQPSFCQPVHLSTHVASQHEPQLNRTKFLQSHHSCCQNSVRWDNSRGCCWSPGHCKSHIRYQKVRCRTIDRFG